MKAKTKEPKFIPQGPRQRSPSPVNDLSFLISRAQNIIDEIDENCEPDPLLPPDPSEVIRQKRADLIQQLAERSTTKQPRKPLPPEIELEIIRLQKRMLKGDSAKPSQVPTNKSEPDGHTPVSNIPGEPTKASHVSLDLAKIDVPFKPIYKRIADSICFLQITFRRPDLQSEESHKLNNQGPS